MACRVVSTASSGAYRLVSDFVTDPDRDAVVISTRLEPGRVARRPAKVYVRYDATVNGNGGGGSSNGGADDAVVDPATTALVSSDPNTETNATNRDYAVPLYGALRADRPFLAASSGYAGTESDGLAQLDADRMLATTYEQAPDGNVVQTGQVDVGGDGRSTLALGFGQSARPRSASPGRRPAHRSPGPPAATCRPGGGTTSGCGRRRRGSRAVPRGGRPAPLGVLAVGERAQGQRGQDVPRRRGRVARQPVGAGGQRG